ncbi:hypothetical protein YP72344_15660 [Yersinia pseudotuberculosis]|uniref:phosphatase domain-containing protein n=1 Tax=Yersinia pseudotuberculosis TaxID=633 RepID=UPI002574307F|nr:HAD family acid phosphatase [Yersinia pseudotuberculosis]BCU90071.1 hypothetical protein YP72344_15660 [Yersinia pseudotuberculosis]
MKNAIIFDLDGTLANIDRRRLILNQKPKNWDLFFEDMINDEPNRPIVELYNALSLTKKYSMLIVSGRPEKYINETQFWLYKNNIEFDKLYMRADKDRRDDSLIKQDILNSILSNGFKIILSVDDRSSVVAMWRKNGITCLQCADGNF